MRTEAQGHGYLMNGKMKYLDRTEYTKFLLVIGLILPVYSCGKIRLPLVDSPNIMIGDVLYSGTDSLMVDSDTITAEYRVAKYSHKLVDLPENSVRLSLSFSFPNTYSIDLSKSSFQDSEIVLQDSVPRRMKSSLSTLNQTDFYYENVGAIDLSNIPPIAVLDSVLILNGDSTLDYTLSMRALASEIKNN